MPDLEADYAGMNVGSMHVITSAGMDEETIYQTIKLLWENRDKIGAICLASTSLPFLDRQNAGIVAEALAGARTAGTARSRPRDRETRECTARGATRRR